LELSNVSLELTGELHEEVCVTRSNLLIEAFKAYIHFPHDNRGKTLAERQTDLNTCARAYDEQRVSLEHVFPLAGLELFTRYLQFPETPLHIIRARMPL
jgi:hypothetical protein